MWLVHESNFGHCCNRFCYAMSQIRKIYSFLPIDNRSTFCEEMLQKFGSYEFIVDFAWFSYGQNFIWFLSWAGVTPEFHVFSHLKKLSNNTETGQVLQQWQKLCLRTRGASSNMVSAYVEKIMVLTLKITRWQEVFVFCATELWDLFLCIINIFVYEFF